MRIPDLTVVGTSTGFLDRQELGKLECLTIYSAAGNGVGAVEVAATKADVAVAGDFRPLFSLGSAVTVPANSAVTITELGWESFRITGTATNVFQLSGQEHEHLR